MNSELQKEYIFIFNSIHRVMKAERILKRDGIKFVLMPVPRQLSSDCGLSIKYTGDNYESVKGLLVSEFADKVLAYEKGDGDNYIKVL